MWFWLCVFLGACPTLPVASGVEQLIVLNGVQTLEPHDLQRAQPPRQMRTHTYVNITMWCPNRVRLFGFKMWLTALPPNLASSHLPSRTSIWPRFCSCWRDPCLTQSWPLTSATAWVSEINLDPGHCWSWSSATPFWEHTVWMNCSSLEPDFVSTGLSSYKREKASVF